MTIRRELWIPLAVAGVGAVFAVVCLAVRLSRGHPWFIRRKLAVGAVLLSLTWAAAGCSDENSPGGGTTCYMPAPPPDEIQIECEYNEHGILQVDLATSTLITGWVRWRESTEFSFQLRDVGDAEVLVQGPVLPVDGAYDAATEEWTMDLGDGVSPGHHRLRIYRGSVANQQQENLLWLDLLAVADTP